MKFHKSNAHVFIPNGQPPETAIRRVRRLASMAHQDDVECLAFHGIIEAIDSKRLDFGAVICTDGAGSARTGKYANYSADDMRQVRREEQCQAARIGEYAAVVQLDYTSQEVKSALNKNLVDDLYALFNEAQAEIVYTHPPTDKHLTHVGVFAATIAALRALPQHKKPKQLLGCEGWRNLDWIDDKDKVLLNVGGHDALIRDLLNVFDSQIAGGKHYDLAVEGRWRANATFLDSHAVDEADLVTFALDLTPLIQDSSLDVAAFANQHVEKLKANVTSALGRFF